MKTNHTPGPWHVGMNPGPIIYGPKGEQIADYRSEFLERNERGHNARLGAAAPELLKALESLFEHCSMVHKHWGEDCNQKQADEAQARARAAIAKARGESVEVES